MTTFKRAKLLTFLMFVLLISGCALLRVRHAEVYPMSFDQTYLIAMDALDDLDSWRLSETDQTMGTITVERMHYIGSEDQITFVVKRLEPFKTKVELHGRRAWPWTNKYFEAINRRMEQRAVTYPS